MPQYQISVLCDCRGRQETAISTITALLHENDAINKIDRSKESAGAIFLEVSTQERIALRIQSLASVQFVKKMKER